MAATNIPDNSFDTSTLTPSGDGAIRSAYPTGVAPVTGTVTVSGTTTEGQTLTGDDSGISSVANLGTKSRQWYWADTGAPIIGATDLAYPLVTNDVGHTLKMVSFGTDGWGNGWTSDSADTAVIAEAVAGDWQVTNYNATVITPEVIHPRPDSETNSWAKHRYHTDDHAYRVPIGMSFGSWPYFFELITAPTGMTIGQQLTVSGDKLIAGANYGVIDWAAVDMATGTHSIDVKVSFQDGTTPINITWDLVVVADATANVIYLAPSTASPAGSDITGDGTKAAPFETMDGWFESDNSLTTYTGHQVCYRAGTYDVSTSDVASTPYMRMQFHNKPLVHYAYPSEAVIWDFTPGGMNFGVSSGATSSGGLYHMEDWYISGIECTGGSQLDATSRWTLAALTRGNFPYDGTGGGQRCTWFECPQTSWTYTGNALNNTAIVFGFDTGEPTEGRSHWLISKCDATNISTSPVQGNFNGWFVGNMSWFLMENLSTSGCLFGRGYMSGKSSEYRSCYRNLDHSASDTVFSPDNAGSYATDIGGGHEISYCKMEETTSAAVANVFISGHHGQPADRYDAAHAYHLPNYEFRNSMSKGAAAAGEAWYSFWDWPVYSNDTILLSSGDGYNVTTPENGTADNVLYAIGSSPFDANLDLTGTPRTTYLGVKGAEVAP